MAWRRRKEHGCRKMSFYVPFDPKHFNQKGMMDAFLDAINKETFPIPITVFIGHLQLLSHYTYVWFTYSGNAHWLKQIPEFLHNHIPTNPDQVYKREKGQKTTSMLYPMINIMPDSFREPIFFRIMTTGEGFCTLAIDTLID